MPPGITSTDRVSVLKICFDSVYNAAATVREDLNPEDSAGDVNDGHVIWSEHMAAILFSLSKYCILSMQTFCYSDYTPQARNPCMATCLVTFKSLPVEHLIPGLRG